MHRTAVGRGRILAVVGALVILVGCILPWYSLGGDRGTLPAVASNAFNTSGILTFLAALATIAVVVMPYAGERAVGIDRTLVYGSLTLLAAIGLLLWLPTVVTDVAGAVPTRAPGFWIAALGTVILARAAYEIHAEPDLR
jgi:hypothetical protein